jgi:DNA-binding CsgD family transcriptional regulator/DNA-binding MarR family transcriptional regulator
MLHQPIPIDRPGLMEVVADLEAMTAWELLRRSRPVSVETLAARAACTPQRMQRLIDRLVDAGLVERRPVGGRRRTTTYRVTVPEIRVTVAGLPPQEVDTLVARWERSRIELFERLTQQPEARRDGSTKRGFGMEWAYLGDEEGRRISGLIREVFGILLAAKDRHAREHPDGSPPPPESGLHPYAVLFRLAAITRPVLPEANVVFSRPPKGETTESQQASAARGRLSPREREIAELLAKGLSRPQVAAALQLSPHTVVSLSQRIYEKFGIRTRAELARIMLMRI